jgi:hypothetical protein
MKCKGEESKGEEEEETRRKTRGVRRRENGNHYTR